MKIQYDADVLIAGLGIVPWTRLGPERWFPNYKIISGAGWDLPAMPGLPEVFALADQTGPLPDMAKLTSQNLLDTSQFQSMLQKTIPGYAIFTYKPVRLPENLLQSGITFKMMDQSLTKTIENKAAFREQFADLELPFPAFTIYDRASLRADVKTLHTILGTRSSVILQDEIISGGRGTFVIQTIKDLQGALASIEAMDSGTRVVVSEHITPVRERSVQACATRYGTFVGPLQKQVIADPLLANLKVPNSDRFCGAEISPSDPLQGTYKEIKQYAERIGNRLTELGYRGIFSVDCLVDERSKVYVIEVNPRVTGITPLVTALYRKGKDIPFYLLHILENMGMDYEIIDDTVTEVPPTGSLMILHGSNAKPATIVRSPASGLYDQDGVFLRQAFRPDDTHYLIQKYASDFPIVPGGRICSIISQQPILDHQDALLPETIKVVECLKKGVVVRDIV
jgi:biotin carboxylase